MKKLRLVIIIAVILALVIAGFILFRKLQPVTQPQDQAENTNNNENELILKNEIQIKEEGFVPGFLEVSKGSVIHFRNSTSREASVNSDPHPNHTLYPDLNIGIISPGMVTQITLDSPGTYTYHNHFIPEQKGVIKVN